MKEYFRWNKVISGVDIVTESDKAVLDLLMSLENNLKWTDLIPTGLKHSYVSSSLYTFSIYISNLFVYDYRIECLSV